MCTTVPPRLVHEKDLQRTSVSRVAFSTIVPFREIANGLNEKGSTMKRPTIDLLLMSAHYFEKQP
jgi:hypothetical protein